MKMSKLAALQGKGQTFKIGGVELELKPLTIEEIELFAMDDKLSMEEQMKSSKKLISKVLKNSIPDTTDEEISKISLEHLQELMSAIMKLHKMSGEDTRVNKIKDVIQARKNKEKSN